MIDVTPFIKSLEGRAVAVFGLARSGLSTVKALKAAGAETVYAWDDRADARNKAQTLGANVQPLDGVLAHCGALVLAPGVPLTLNPHPVVLAAQAAGVEILCDIEVFYRSIKDEPDAPIMVGITGTNGKSTTTALLTHVLNENDVPAVMAGNIGVPVLDVDLMTLKHNTNRAVVVLELSSYQLDLCPELALDIAVLLNVTPDHLDRHGTMAAYIAAKKRIFDGSKVQITAVDDGYTQDVYSAVGGLSVSADYDFSDIHNPNLRGIHNAQNMAAVLVVSRELGCADADVKAALCSFSGLAHRQNVVREIDGVLYVNDSKATNAEAAAKALAAYDDIFWIIGGQAKEGGLEGLEIYKDKIRYAFIIGEAADDFAAWCTAHNVAYTRCDVLERAVLSAHDMAHKSGAKAGTVLLSPACASWDQYPSFEMRGDEFVRIIKGL